MTKREMTNEEAIQILKQYLDMDSEVKSEYLEAQRMAIKALEQQPCEDAISREEAIDRMMRKNMPVGEDSTKERFRYLQWLSDLETIKELSSVTPQRPKGQWIEQKVCNCYATLKCSVCDRIIEPTFTYGEYSYDDIKEWYPFCHCGADMRESEDAL